MVLEEVKGDVDLEHVYFSYEPEQKLIEDFNLHVNPGERVSIDEVASSKISIGGRQSITLVMKDGHIIEQGNHEELLQKNGFYAALYNSQFAQS